MHFLDLTLTRLAENLALDEALLDEAERLEAETLAAGGGEVLRLWESPATAVILGRSSRAGDEANLDLCEAENVPVLRRTSGGCAVVIGPGCLMYSAVLSYERHPQLRILDEAHRFVMQRLQQALAGLLDGVQFAGTCDLTWRGRKFSGNSLRCKRSHLLYHGTLLYDFPVAAIARYLRTPPREPEYRAARPHHDFVTNVPVDPKRLKERLSAAFAASTPRGAWPVEQVAQLMATRYGRPEWHRER
jgi:lipoate-protein ligase A